VRIPQQFHGSVPLQLGYSMECCAPARNEIRLGGFVRDTKALCGCIRFGISEFASLVRKSY